MTAPPAKPDNPTGGHCPDIPGPLPTPLGGVLFLVATAMLFALMGVLVRVLVVGRAENVFWIGWIRFVVGALAMLVPALGGAWSLRVRNRPVFVLRGVIGSTGMFLLYVVISSVGLGRGTVLVYLMAVVGAVSGVLILGEKPRPVVVFAVLLGTIGVFLSCRSGFPRGAEWLAVAGALCSGVTLSLVRLLRRTDTNQVVFCSQGVFGSLILLPFLWGAEPPHSVTSWLMIAAMIGADNAGQLCMNEGLARTPVAVGSSLMLLTPILSLFAGVLLFGEALTLVQWLGCGLVLGAAALGVLSKAREKA